MSNDSRSIEKVSGNTRSEDHQHSKEFVLVCSSCGQGSSHRRSTEDRLSGLRRRDVGYPDLDRQLGPWPKAVRCRIGHFLLLQKQSRQV
jgi:hypothetical protein